VFADQVGNATDDLGVASRSAVTQPLDDDELPPPASVTASEAIR
jgi:hypothetical protein